MLQELADSLGRRFVDLVKQHRELDSVVYVGEVEGLADISESDSHIEIGGAATFSDAMPVDSRSRASSALTSWSRMIRTFSISMRSGPPNGRRSGAVRATSTTP